MRQITYTGFEAALRRNPLDFASMDPRDEVVCDADITTQRRSWLSLRAWSLPLVGVVWDRVHAPASAGGATEGDVTAAQEDDDAATIADRKKMRR